MRDTLYRLCSDVGILLPLAFCTFFFTCFLIRFISCVNIQTIFGLTISFFAYCYFLTNFNKLLKNVKFSFCIIFFCIRVRLCMIRFSSGGMIRF